MGIPEAVTPEVRKQSDLVQFSWVSPPSVVLGSDTTELGVVEKSPWEFLNSKFETAAESESFSFHRLVCFDWSAPTEQLCW